MKSKNCINKPEDAQLLINFMGGIATTKNVSCDDFAKMWDELKQDLKRFGTEFVIDSIKREPKKTANSLWETIHGGRVRFNV